MSEDFLSLDDILAIFNAHPLGVAVGNVIVPTRRPTCPTAAAVARKIADRADVGLRKYGTTLAQAGLSRRELLVHAQEEAMDLAVYLQRLIEMEGER